MLALLAWVDMRIKLNSYPFPTLLLLSFANFTYRLLPGHHDLPFGLVRPLLVRAGALNMLVLFLSGRAPLPPHTNIHRGPVSLPSLVFADRSCASLLASP